MQDSRNSHGAIVVWQNLICIARVFLRIHYVHTYVVRGEFTNLTSFYILCCKPDTSGLYDRY